MKLNSIGALIPVIIWGAVEIFKAVVNLVQSKEPEPKKAKEQDGHENG